MFTTMAQIVKAAKAADNSFFSKETMEYHESSFLIGKHVFATPDGAYFVIKNKYDFVVYKATLRGDDDKFEIHPVSTYPVASDADKDAQTFAEQANEPKITPLAYRVYQCTKCGNELTTQTNHRMTMYPQCAGKCKDYTAVGHNEHAREVVSRKQTAHEFVRDAS